MSNKNITSHQKNINFNDLANKERELVHRKHISNSKNKRLIEYNNPPKRYLCSLTGAIMEHPVTLIDNNSLDRLNYEKSAILRYIENTLYPILRNIPISKSSIFDNYELEKEIKDWKYSIKEIKEDHDDNITVKTINNKIGDDLSSCTTETSKRVPFKANDIQRNKNITALKIDNENNPKFKDKNKKIIRKNINIRSSDSMVTKYNKNDNNFSHVINNADKGKKIYSKSPPTSKPFFSDNLSHKINIDNCNANTNENHDSKNDEIITPNIFIDPSSNDSKFKNNYHINDTINSNILAKSESLFSSTDNLKLTTHIPKLNTYYKISHSIQKYVTNINNNTNNSTSYINNTKDKFPTFPYILKHICSNKFIILYQKQDFLTNKESIQLEVLEYIYISNELNTLTNSDNDKEQIRISDFEVNLNHFDIHILNETYFITTTAVLSNSSYYSQFTLFRLNEHSESHHNDNIIIKIRSYVLDEEYLVSGADSLLINHEEINDSKYSNSYYTNNAVFSLLISDKAGHIKLVSFNSNSEVLFFSPIINLSDHSNSMNNSNNNNNNNNNNNSTNVSNHINNTLIYNNNAYVSISRVHNESYVFCLFKYSNNKLNCCKLSFNNLDQTLISGYMNKITIDVGSYFILETVSEMEYAIKTVNKELALVSYFKKDSYNQTISMIQLYSDKMILHKTVDITDMSIRFLPCFSDVVNSTIIGLNCLNNSLVYFTYDAHNYNFDCLESGDKDYKSNVEGMINSLRSIIYRGINDRQFIVLDVDMNIDYNSNNCKNSLKFLEISEF